eukprot:CAMPEP_0197522160 /NCGR_PEP_ID=MMETSP1318-20131121/7349_1 /TAXON_ID=552666 /ORGANISM="Partenskyella glossopodia, Strain RCC365" /LENGTH=44 /DNA_ID= /DNA_START= /DNA_END= /DNA_ORIENTATION=
MGLGLADLVAMSGSVHASGVGYSSGGSAGAGFFEAIPRSLAEVI